MKKVALWMVVVLLLLTGCGARFTLEGDSVVVGITPPAGQSDAADADSAEPPVVIQTESNASADSILSHPVVIGLLVLLGVILVVLLVRATDRGPRADDRVPQSRDVPPTDDPDRLQR